MDFTLIVGNRNYSSWSFRGWLIAKKSQADFETRKVSLFTEKYFREEKQLSPSGLVPVLLLRDLAIHDSLAIGEYLAERYPQAQLWPQPRQVRAVARSFSCEMHSGFNAVRTEMPMNIKAKDRKIELSSAALQQIDRMFSIWRECLAIDLGEPRTDGFLFGRFSILDAMLIPVVFRFVTYNVSIPEEFQAYVKCCLEDPDVQSWVSLALDESDVLEQMEVGS